MQLILKPISDARLREIIVTESLFAIGRNEPHFDEYDETVVRRLSRRHARIFERDGRAYVADLASSNGTTVNGKNVGREPVLLRLNDEIQFGGLRYRVEHVAEAGTTRTMSQSQTDARIVLSPSKPDSPLSPIVIANFPCLIGRYSSLFSDSDAAVSSQLTQISKKHAHLFVRDGQVCVEDLGSTNGTYVCSERLTEHARELRDGDTIAFGGDFFVFVVQSFIGKGTVIEAEQKISQLAQGTVFVDDATNFFDIYMGGDDAEQSSKEVEDDPAKTGVHQRRRPARRSGFGRFLSVAREALRSLGGTRVDRRLRWTILGALAVLAGGLGGYAYLVRPAQEVESLLANDDFEGAASLAEHYLARRPNNERLQELATQARLQAQLPAWLAAINAGDIRSAVRVLTQIRGASANNPSDDELIDALGLATRLYAVDVESATSTMITTPDGDESIAALVSQWDEQQNRNARALTRIESYVDGFEAFQSTFYRKLRALRDQYAEDSPQQTLSVDIDSALANRDTQALRASVRAFFDGNPDTPEALALQRDLRRYESVELHVSNGEWLKAHEILNQAPFETAPFIRQARLMNDGVLPDDETRAGYARAATAWYEGNALEAFDLLTALREERWGDDAAVLLERQRGLLDALVALQQNQSADDFAERLFTLYSRLDPNVDGYLHDALRPDFDRYSEQALVRANEQLEQAERAWRDYEQAGRLTSEHRLDDQVSNEFRRLASLLSQAYRNLATSSGIYRQLDEAPPDAWTALNSNVIREIKLQTQAIGDLLVIESDVQQAKLELLPELSGS
ncbi:MAG: FHA domain-containing protein [Pseudomonadota bacterium]